MNTDYTPQPRLTNRRIDHYALLGRYGTKEQSRVLSGIRSGSIRHLDAAIREHRYDACANTALKERKVREPRVKQVDPYEGLSPKEILERIFGADYFA